ncbi:MAG TPA: hypothetical protein VGL61_36570 [Kofleriaceae bacterium]
MKPELVAERVRAAVADVTVGIAALVGAARGKSRGPRELDQTTLRDGSRAWRTQISP